MADDGIVLVKQATNGDRRIDNAVVTNDAGQEVYRQKVVANPASAVSTANSVLDVTLDADTEWVGEWEDITGWSLITYAHNGTPAAAAGNIQFEFSFDQTQVDVTAGALENSGVGLSAPHTLTPVGRWFRLRYTNGSTPLADFRLQTMLHSSKSAKLTRFPIQTLTDYDDVDFVRSIDTGKAPTGDYVNLPVGGHDPDNYTAAALTADETYVGTYRRTHGYSSALVFAFGDQPLADIKVQWSSDGINPRVGLVSTSSLLSSEQETSGFYVYLTTVTTMVDAYARLEITNGPDAQGTFEADIWWYDDPFPGSYGGLEANLSTLSTALLTRAVLAGTTPDGDFRNARIGGEVSALTTTVLLVADGTFTGPITAVEGFVTLGVSVRSDQNSAVNGLLVRWWSDEAGTTLLRDVSLAYDSAPDGVFFQSPVQGPYVQVVYTNGPIGQNDFSLHTQFDVASPGPLMQSLSEPLTDTLLANTVRAITALRKDDASYVSSKATDAGNLCIAIQEATAEVPIKSLSSWRTNQANVPSSTPVQIISSPLTGRRSFAIKNLGAGQVYLRPSSGVSTSNSWPLDSRESIVLELDEESEVWALGEDAGEATSSSQESGDTVTNNGATDPNNALASDNTRATLTATGQSISVDGYSAPGSQPDIQSVTIGFEGRRATSPTTETVAHAETVTGTQAGGTSVTTSSSVTSDPERFYLATVTRQTTSAAISNLTGLGLTWTRVVGGTGSTTRTSVWRGDGTPTGNGTVTANFDSNAGNSCIAVSSFTGVDLADPIENSEALTTGGASYSDSIVGTDQGLVYVGVGRGRFAHTPGSGSTEQAEVSVGGGSNERGIAITTRQLSATGSAAYSGTFAGSPGWSLGAVTILPAAAADPVVTLSYELDGEAGATSQQFTLTSTSDGDHETDITGDVAFEAADIALLALIVTADDVTAVAAEIDHVYIDLVEVGAGGSQRVAWVEVAT